MEVLQNLNQGFFQPGDLQTIFNTPDKTDRVDLCADVFEETADEYCLNSNTSA